MHTKLSRREFAASASALCLAGALSLQGDSTMAAEKPRAMKWRGVNLGGWLVLEKWMTPTLFEGLHAEDEWQFCEELGDKAANRLRAHYESFITAKDFDWIRQHGLNSVRLPVGYWALQAQKPFPATLEQLDFAFDQADRTGLKILLDLHGAPGSQNGWDHSGRSGKMLWHTSKDYINQTLDIVEELAKRYAKRRSLMGIELLNEPRYDCPLEILKQYYLDGYQRVRKHIPAEKASVAFHDGFRHNSWGDFMQTSEYKNVLLDTHLYHCFEEEDQRFTLKQQIDKASHARLKQVQETAAQLPTIVAEWSLALSGAATQGLSKQERDQQLLAFGAAQRATYETADGWFFWTYKTEDQGGWNYRASVEKGWLPEKLG